MFSLKIS